MVRIEKWLIPWQYEHLPEAVYTVAQSYLTVTAQFIKPAQLPDKDPPTLSHMMAAMPLFTLITACCVLGVLLIFVPFGDTGWMENFL